MIVKDELNEIQILRLVEIALSKIITIAKAVDNKEKNEIFLSNLNQLRGLISEVKAPEEIDHLFNKLTMLPALQAIIGAFSSNSISNFANQLITSLEKFANTQCVKKSFFSSAPTLLKGIILIATEQLRNEMSAVKKLSALEIGDRALVKGDYVKAGNKYNKIPLNELNKNNNPLNKGIYDYIASQTLTADLLQQMDQLKIVTLQDIDKVDALDNFIVQSWSEPYCTNNPFASGQFQSADKQMPELKAKILLAKITDEFPKKNTLNQNGKVKVGNASYLRARMIIREFFGVQHFKFGLDNVLGINQEEQNFIDIEPSLREYLKDSKIKHVFTIMLLTSINKVLETNSIFTNSNETKNTSDEEGLSKDDKQEMIKYRNKIEEITGITVSQSAVYKS